MAASVASRRTGNLPADVTKFVGRRGELAEIKAMLEQARLVTLIGMGGVGKTRLALRVAADAQRAFPDGAWLVELAGLRDPGLVGHAVAAALGLRQQATAWSLASLSDLIDERQLLLVLDNCEHVLDATAVLAATLLRACPGLRILTTSRQPLRIDGEHCVEVEPLATPDRDIPLSVARVAGSDAVSLFVDRAAAVQPGFRLDENNAAAVASICRRLDGIPLALELGAGRLRALSVEQLRQRLNSRYEVLVGGSRAALPRQQTMRALIEWSYVLCTTSEQLLWARLSVFAEGFSLAAAEDVCSDERIPASAIFETLEGLVDKSVVSAAKVDGEQRYRLPETLREYGADRLAKSGEHAAVHRRAVAWCGRLVERFGREWFGPDQAQLLREVRREHANIVAALDFCLSDASDAAEPADLTSGLQIAAGLRFYWTNSGRLSDGRHWLDRLLSRDRTPDRVRLFALCVDAYLASGHTLANTDIPQMLDEAQTLADDLDDEWGAAYIAQTRGVVHELLGDPRPAVALLQEATDAHRRQGDLGATAYDLALLGTAMSAAGDPHVASVLEECVSLCNAAGENWTLAIALWTLGVERFKAGDLTGAEAAQRESLQLRVPLDTRYLIAVNLDGLAHVAVVGGDADRGARLFGAADAVMRDVAGALVSRGPTGPLHQANKSRALHTLGAARFNDAYSSGLTMDFDGAVRYALGAAEAAQTPTLEQPTPAVPVNSPAATVLTRREFEVARLVARGLTNKQIAGALVISQRTAEGHVEHVLGKLGFTSRAQIAAWVTEQDAGTQPTQ
jgi:predicted ATPase/DNA-binding CsgD family transcriptional regulator